jgi:hypothetical protein
MANKLHLYNYLHHLEWVYVTRLSVGQNIVKHVRIFFRDGIEETDYYNALLEMFGIIYCNNFYVDTFIIK